MTPAYEQMRPARLEYLMRRFGRRAALAFIAVFVSTGLLALTACSGSSSETTTTATSSAPTSTTEPSGQGGGFFDQRGGTSGTITGIDGGVLTLSTANGEMTVNITANTTVQRVVAGALGDLKVGQFLSVAGTPGASGDIAASSVTVTTRTFGSGFSPPTGSPPDGGGQFSPPDGTPQFTRPTDMPANDTTGTIADISGNRVTLSTQQGQQVTVIVSSDTAIEVTTDAGVADLRVGLSVTVSGRSPQADQGSIDAFTITINR
jgi:hypothetical protein